MRMDKYNSLLQRWHWSTLLAIAPWLFIGCTEDIWSNKVAGTAEEIEWNVGVENAVTTRGEAVNAANVHSKVTDFRAWAYNNAEDNLYLGQSATVGRTVTNTGTVMSPAWTYSPVQFWPVNPLNFVAITPADDTSITSNSTVASSGVVTLTSSVTLGTNVKDQKDIMMAYADEVTRSTDGGRVPLNFQHALAQVVFRGKINAHGAITKATITEISLCNINKTGALTFSSKGNFYGGTTMSPVFKPASVSNPATFTLDADDLEGSVWEIGNNASEGVPFNLTVSNSAGNKQNAWFMIPQSTTAWSGPAAVGASPTSGSYLRIRTKLERNGITLLGNAEADALYIPLAANWDRSKKYIYTLDFNGANALNPIVLDIVVKDWGEEGIGDYLTFTAEEEGTFSLTLPEKINTDYIQEVAYSLNNGETWNTVVNTSEEVIVTTPTVAAGGTVLWKGIGTSYSINESSNNHSFFSATGRFSARGNIMSLLYGDDFVEEKSLEGKNNAYRDLFFNNNKLSSAEKLILPATTLTDGCYMGMFSGCTALTTPPKLPAETLAANCYANMFQNCTVLATAPELLATTLTDGCYMGMFSGCTALTAAPELLATTLTDGCYMGMFSGCTALTTPPALPATSLTYGCYKYMFQNCSSLTTAPELPATTLASNCYTSMFQNCTTLTTPPALPVESMNDWCYASMFNGCTSLTTAPVLPATTLANSCYNHMFQNCSSLTTAPELPATTLTYGCYMGMFQNCTALTTAPELPATTLANGCYLGMFQNCTALTTAPELPATTLTTNCYANMFQNCSSLNYIKVAFTTTPSGDYSNYWVDGVASSGTFYKNSAATWTTTGVNGVPSGWTVQTYTP